MHDLFSASLSYHPYSVVSNEPVTEFVGLCVSSVSPWHPTCMRVYLSSRKGKIFDGAKVKITKDKK